MKRAAKLFGARFNPNSRLSLMAKKADGKKLQVTEKAYSAACISASNYPQICDCDFSLALCE